MSCGSVRSGRARHCDAPGHDLPAGKDSTEVDAGLCPLVLVAPKHGGSTCRTGSQSTTTNGPAAVKDQYVRDLSDFGNYGGRAERIVPSGGRHDHGDHRCREYW
jgi:hypothetical protein